MTNKPFFLIYTLFFFTLGVPAVFSQPYTLPELNYNYAAYEPYIDAQTMEIHHSKHHQGYVNKLNNAIQGTKYESMDLRDLMLNASLLDESIRNNAGGHYNHSLFWTILNPARNEENMNEVFKVAIEKEFQSLDSLKTLLGKAAAKHFGSGWAWLVLTPEKRLVVSSTPNQDNPVMDVSPVRGIPIIGIDVWEHAYYLKYQNKRKDYLVGIWELLDWNIISNKYLEALNDPFLIDIKENSWSELKAFKLSLDRFKFAIQQSSSSAQQTIPALYASSLVLNESMRPEKYQNKEIDLLLSKIKKDCAWILKNPELEKSPDKITSKLSSIQNLLKTIHAFE